MSGERLLVVPQREYGEGHDSINEKNGHTKAQPEGGGLKVAPALHGEVHESDVAAEVEESMFECRETVAGDEHLDQSGSLPYNGDIRETGLHTPPRIAKAVHALAEENEDYLVQSMCAAVEGGEVLPAQHAPDFAVMGRHRLSRKMADIEETAFQLTVDQERELARSRFLGLSTLV